MTFTINPFGRKAATALVALAASALPIAVLADEVTLKSADGTVNIVGEFIDYTDNNYVIRTGLGDLRIAGSRVSCFGDACPEFDVNTADVYIAGSETVGLGLMPLLMSGYASFLDAEATMEASENGTEVLATLVGDGGFGDDIGSYSVSSTNSSDAFAMLNSGEATIGMSARRILPDEARALKANGAGNMISPKQEHIVAIDSIVVIAHPSNGVNRLTIEQLRDIYAGEITNWSEVGGTDTPITLVSRQADSGTRTVFEARLFGDEEPASGVPASIAGDNNSVAEMVNSNEGAVGYVGYAFQRGAKPLAVVNECGIETTPDDFSAKTEEYVFQRRMYLYSREDTLQETAKDFIDYSLSSEADGVILKAGFIDLGVSSRPQPLDSDRARALLDPEADAFEGGVMREMLGKMVDYDRLSTTFRFKTGSSRLDERAPLDMARLTDYLQEVPAGTRVTFVGFTDSIGAFASNRSLSEGRAEEVKRAVAAFGGERLSHVEFDHAGFGEIAPTGCNTNEAGRANNRRVEVWIGKSENS